MREVANEGVDDIHHKKPEIPFSLELWHCSCWFENPLRIKVMGRLKKYKNVKVLKTSLSKEQEEHLREAFAGQDVKVTL